MSNMALKRMAAPRNARTAAPRIAHLDRLGCGVLGIADNVESITGEGNIQTYELPSGWGTAFCRTCGSPLSALAGDRSMWFVPAGLLDEDPEVGARCRLHTSTDEGEVR